MAPSSVKNQEKQRMLLNQNANDVDQHIKEKLDLKQNNLPLLQYSGFPYTKDTAHINESVVHRKGNGNKVNLMTSAVGHFQCYLSDCTKLYYSAIPANGGTSVHN